MSDTLLYDPKSLSGRGNLELDTSSDSASVPEEARDRRVPLFIPREQVYFWTAEWQKGEAEADAELRRGEARSFDDPEEALRWLDEPEG